MAKITVYNELMASATTVPNIFIDEYMTNANGEYVKVYLYLLRSISQADCDFSLSQIADHFDCPERDILRALKYWEKLRLFHLEYDSNHNLSGIRFLANAFAGSDMSEAARDTGMPACQTLAKEEADSTNRLIRSITPAKPSYSMSQLKEFKEQEDVAELIFISEQYLKRTLTATDLSSLFYWYDEMKLSTELIEYMIESCVAKGHTSIHYMQKVAEDFVARGISTVDQAKALMNQDSAVYRLVMKAFGIRGRNLVPSELSYLKNWTGKMGFSSEMIQEACNRTVLTTHEASFGYANSILENWQKQNIRNLEDLKAADEIFQQNQKGKRSKTATGGTTRFVNFKQRDNNYEELQKQLIQSSMQ